MSKLVQLPDNALLSKLNASVASENSQLAQTLLLLSEVSARSLHAQLGFSSLFEFCRDKLCLSEGSIYRRTQVARAIRRHPLLYQLIRDSKLTLTTASLICPHLKDVPKNTNLFIQKFVGKSKQQVQDILASLGKVKVTRPDRVRRLPDRKFTRPPLPATPVVLQPVKPYSSAHHTSMAGVSTIDSHPPTSTPAREKQYEFTFAAGAALQDLITEVKNTLSHKFPTGRLEDILTEALTHYLNATLPRPRRKSDATESHSRYIPNSTKQVVLTRAKKRCEWVGPAGQRCSGQRFLHIDHKRPLSLGGKTTLENLQVLCSAHNLLKAKQDHGARFIELKASADRQNAGR